MLFEEKEILMLIISITLLLILIGGLFFLLIIISRKRKQNYEKLLLLEKLKNKELELEKLKSIHEERERIISDLHDELGGSLNSIQLISSLIVNNNLDQEKIIKYVSTIVETSKNVSQQIKMVVWSLDSKKDNLLNLVEYIKHYSENFLQPTGIFLHFQNLFLPEDLSVNGFFRKNIFLTLKEILNNAVKHSKATEINISIETKNKYLQICVQDNGIGLQTENPFGNGLHNIRKRIENLGGTVTFKNENGTKISIEVEL